MNEEFLHFVWQNKLFHPGNLLTLDGQKLEIIHPGIINTDAGPDFFNAKIKLNNTLWAGNVEIHTNEKDWYSHKHHTDDSYNNTILHVVKSGDGNTVTSSGRDVPVWQMALSDQLKNNYQSLFFNDRWIACEDQIASIDSLVFSQWLDRMLIERLQEKSEFIHQLLESYTNDWDQVFFILLSRSFGFGVNGLPFEMMAKQTPLKTILKHADNIKQIEALLFGQAGLLKNLKSEDEYTSTLQKEFAFLKHKYNLKPIEAHIWKFAKMRPSNFPTIRLAQLAMLLHQNKGSFEKLLGPTNADQFVDLFDIQASKYWNNHYQLGTISKKNSIKHLGKLPLKEYYTIPSILIFSNISIKIIIRIKRKN